MPVIVIVGGGGIILEIGRAVEQPDSPVRASRFRRAREQGRRRPGDRDITPEGVPAVPC